METEIEAKFLEINKKEIRKKLKTIGAKRIHPEVLMKRKCFDYPDRRLYKKGAWIRVRDEDNKITLSYKQLLNRTIYGTKEITVEVGDFEKMCYLFLLLGFQEKTYQETKREKWIYKKTEITIDTWPWIPSFLEIEGSNKKIVKSISQKLNMDWKNVLHGSVETAYQKYFNVTEEEIDSWEKITFRRTPQWLESKRIK
jgi:adenylate cyclase class 2